VIPVHNKSTTFQTYAFIGLVLGAFNPVSHELMNAIKNGQSVVLEISPKYYSTWDYSKQ
jgi:hypothetical protein